MSDANTNTNGRRWWDPWPVRFLMAALSILWMGSVAVAVHQQGEIGTLKNQAAEDRGRIYAKLESIDQRTQRVENKVDKLNP